MQNFSSQKKGDRQEQLALPVLKMVARIVIHKVLSLEPDFQSKNQECKYEVDVVWIKRVQIYQFRLLEGLHRSTNDFRIPLCEFLAY